MAASGVSVSARIFLVSAFIAAATAIILSSASISHAGSNLNPPFIHHNLKITLYPDSRRFTAEDTITLPDQPHNSPDREISFELHRGLAPSIRTPDVHMSEESSEVFKSGLLPIEFYRVALPAGLHTFTLAYGGPLDRPDVPLAAEHAQKFSENSDMIAENGVYLSGDSYWYPRFDNELITFTVRVTLPGGWDAVSQGLRIFHDRTKKDTNVQWESPEPQEGIFIVAARFSEYVRPAGHYTAMVFLRSPDSGLADKYLEATVRYITMYEKLIGPYPYKKFALVENLWETGLGMPSFTLLGPKIIRFPFIITSSYPHEILHNWWGNSVFPDMAEGNWSEGLTAYLADYLIKEQEGDGAEFRQATLQNYADYVVGNRDFPIFEFRARHSPSSEAIGYGKSLMFFHMLRQELGDKIFVAGLQEIYRAYKFRFASFDDLRKTFEKVSGLALKGMFDEWILRTGAPKLKLRNVNAHPEKNGYVLNALIEQVQPGRTYHLLIPLAVTMEGKEQAFQSRVSMDKGILELSLHLPAQPLRLDIDPEFDIFRRLDREEMPPALSEALGAKKMLILLPASANSTLLQAYREFAVSLVNAGPDTVGIKLDTEVTKLPSDCAVTLLGFENRFLKEVMASLSGYGVKLNRKSVHIGKNEIQMERNSIVLTSRNPKNKDVALDMIATTVPAALPGLSRKLPHYHKYSYLGFEGDEPSNTLKGRWQVLDSPMTAFIHGRDGAVRKVEMAPLSPRTSLALLPAKISLIKEATMKYASSGMIVFALVLTLSGLAAANPKIQEKVVEYSAPGIVMKGYLAYDENIKGKRPGVMVVHEWWGLNDYTRKRARMLAELGYTALAVDMYGEGKEALNPEEATKLSSGVMKNFDDAVARFTAALDYLKQQPTVDPYNIAAIGYCFGGGIVLNMARQGIDLKGAASFHGSLTPVKPAKPGTVKAKILILNGGADKFITPEQIEAFKQEMKAADVGYQFISYPGALHAFTNPDADMYAKKFNLPIGYNADADRKSWEELKQFLHDIFQK